MSVTISSTAAATILINIGLVRAILKPGSTETKAFYLEETFPSSQRRGMFGLAALVGDIFRAKIEEAYQKRRPGDGPCNSSMAYLASDSVPCVDGGTRDDDTRYCVVECRRGSEWSCPANNSYRW